MLYYINTSTAYCIEQIYVSLKKTEEGQILYCTETYIVTAGPNNKAPVYESSALHCTQNFYVNEEFGMLSMHI